MKSLYGAVGPQLLPEETSIRLEGGRATLWLRYVIFYDYDFTRQVTLS